MAERSEARGELRLRLLLLRPAASGWKGRGRARQGGKPRGGGALPSGRPRPAPSGPPPLPPSPFRRRRGTGAGDGHLQRVRGEQGRRAGLPAGPLRAAHGEREDLRLPPGAGPAPARRARPGGLRAARRRPRGPRGAGHQRPGGERALHGRRAGRAGLPEPRRPLPRRHPLRPPAALLQREAHAGLHVPLVVRHRLAAVSRARQLRHRDAGDRHLQAALLPDPDRNQIRRSRRPAAGRDRLPLAQDL